ncbi:MAG: FMN-binding protein, partial [Oscillospiraceae bacterium]|nr:FMN-binding protein [Oscillospiraceae bacterium]
MKKTMAMLLCLAMLFSLMGAAAFADGIYTPGTYTGEAEGMGHVTVTVTVDENSITAVELDTSGETATIGGAHDEEFIAQVLAQGADIDGISGASITS